ncbi:MAG: hypothetical protein AB8I69_16565 [Anaerolineae bacterium]|jgi:hypothetical protein
MKRTARFLALVILLLLVSATAAATAPDADYDLSWWTVDGGGDTALSTGGGYTLGGTAGQPDAGVLTGDGYTLDGGFWGGASVECRVYLPLVVRNY